jgi:hypothetical protein
MAAAKHNLVIEQGVDFTLEVTLTDSSGAAIDVSDDTFSSRIRSLLQAVKMLQEK